MKPLDLVRHDGVDTGHVRQLARVIDGVQAKQPILFANHRRVPRPDKLRLGMDRLGTDSFHKFNQIRMPVPGQDGDSRLAGDVPQPDERVRVERGEDDTLLELELGDGELRQILDSFIIKLICLQLDIERDVGRFNQDEYFLERRDPFPALRPEQAELSKRHILDEAASVRRPVDRLVMDHNEASVARQLDIELNAVDVRQRRLERA